MIKEIYNKVCLTLSKGAKATILESDIREQIKRPSFKIFADIIKSGAFSSHFKELRLFFDIYYYGADKADLREIEEVISDLFFEPIKINDKCAVVIDEIEFEMLAENVLNANFSIDIGSTVIDDSDYEFMEELKEKYNYK